MRNAGVLIGQCDSLRLLFAFLQTYLHGQCRPRDSPSSSKVTKPRRRWSKLCVTTCAARGSGQGNGEKTEKFGVETCQVIRAQPWSVGAGWQVQYCVAGKCIVTGAGNEDVGVDGCLRARMRLRVLVRSPRSRSRRLPRRHESCSHALLILSFLRSISGPTTPTVRTADGSRLSRTMTSAL